MTRLEAVTDALFHLFRDLGVTFDTLDTIDAFDTALPLPALTTRVTVPSSES